MQTLLQYGAHELKPEMQARHHENDTTFLKYEISGDFKTTLDFSCYYLLSATVLLAAACVAVCSAMAVLTATATTFEVCAADAMPSLVENAFTVVLAVARLQVTMPCH